MGLPQINSTVLRKYAVFDWLLFIACLVTSLVMQNIDFSAGFVPNAEFGYDAAPHTNTFISVFQYLVVYLFLPLSIGVTWFALTRDLSVIKTLAAYYFCVSFSSVLAAILAYVIGRPRPDTLSACGGDGTFRDCEAKLSTSDLRWQFHSFPSIPLTEITAGAGFVTLLITDVWHLTDLFALILKMFPVGIAILAFAAECWDRISRPEDAAGGVLIGAMVAGFCYSTFKKGQKNPTVDYGSMSDTIPIPTASSYV